jgi:8-oxo-dGTP pyrophosphatase MutT (NUDIX family)
MEQREILFHGQVGRKPMKRDHLVQCFSKFGEPTATTVLPETGEILRGDLDINAEQLPQRPLTPAAVLIGLIDRPAGLSLILTRRRDDLSHHAGQISFPGGRMEVQDASLMDAALRESHEEIGLHPEQVEVVGRLDDYVTRSGFRIAPFVGLITPPVELIACPLEVAEIFEVPLAYLFDPVNHKTEARRENSVSRRFYAMYYNDNRIWGATAGMIYNLYEFVNQS